MSVMQSFLLLLIAIIFNLGVCHGDVDNNGDQPTFKLKSGISIPLIGMGIGNLAHESIPQVVNAQLGTTGIQLIDTAHASNNERILGEAIASSVVGNSGGGGSIHNTNTRGGHPSEDEHASAPVHVVTKVWYTHLGYERTKISVQESLKDLQQSDSTRQIYVHMLLHWPRCNDEIPWMNCEAEENDLPQSLKEVGPAPHLNKEGAFLLSWNALEDVYTEHQNILSNSRNSKKVYPPIIVSIGVSNFELEDMKQLMENSRIPPHIYQGNAWALFHDPYLMNFLREHGIFFQAYAVMNGILQRRNDSPNAYNILSNMSRELMATVHSSQEEGTVITEATVLLAYFLHSDVGVIPRAASSSHQRENSPRALSAILPHLTTSHKQQLELAIPALMKGEDIHASVSFMNSLSGPIQIHWVNPETSEEVLVSNHIHPGSVEMHQTHPGHRFVAYDEDRAVRKEYVVDVMYGEIQHFMVEL